MMPVTIDVVREHLYTNIEELKKKFTPLVVERIMRIRDMYNWFLAHPEFKDRQFVEEEVSRFSVRKPVAYEDMRIVKAVLSELLKNSRDFHRWRFNEMILTTYQMAKARKDTKTMERASASYAKYNRIDVEDEMEVPFDLIVVQPFTATDDPSVLGIKPIPNIDKKIDEMITKYRKETIDIDDIEFEQVDVDEGIVYVPINNKDAEKEDGNGIR